MKPNYPTETIAAIATPPGRGGIGIIRISGSKALSIAKKLTGKIPEARYAHLSSFKDEKGQELDQGIMLYFKAPHSFTGEDVLELQVHGGPVVLDQLLKCVLSETDVRPARAGEFSERAYLNDKIDLLQAEAISDLINANTEQAARAALRSLQGEFSLKVNELLKRLINLRIFVEAAIDFPEEEIDFIKESRCENELNDLIENVDRVFKASRQGSLLQEGITVVVVGKPNAGKSSLLNVLSGKDSAIVTEIAGTTRDVLREHINLDGLPLHIIDTAGLRESTDPVEQEGIRRAHIELEKADMVLFVVDASTENAQSSLEQIPENFRQLITKLPAITVLNKIDLLNEVPVLKQEHDETIISLSAKKNLGIDLLIEQLKRQAGYQHTMEGNFSARRRHLNALEKTQTSLQKALTQLQTQHAYELVAEDLRQAQTSLSELTGDFSNDDLLGEIFSSFCIGK